jgi:hypothetical protein
MATVREHLKDAHSAMAGFHRSMQKCHTDAMGKAEDPHHAFHKAAAKNHQDAADAHDAMCNECAKAADGDLNKLVPTQISGVTPDNPTRVTAVPRFGAPPLQKSDVDPEFAKLFERDVRDVQ